MLQFFILGSLQLLGYLIYKLMIVIKMYKEKLTYIHILNRLCGRVEEKILKKNISTDFVISRKKNLYFQKQPNANTELQT